MAEQDNAEAAELTLLAEKTVQQPVKASTFAYCPTLDLLALATNEEKVYIYRLNGQRVVGTGSKKPGLQVRQIHWKPNGAVRLSGIARDRVDRAWLMARGQANYCQLPGTINMSA